MSDYGEMIYNVTRDIARWDLKRKGFNTDSDSVEAWVEGIQSYSKNNEWEALCKEYWAEYHGNAERSRQSYH